MNKKKQILRLLNKVYMSLHIIGNAMYENERNRLLYPISNSINPKNRENVYTRKLARI
jgi:hypothetical protein